MERIPDEERVVITGMGAITALGPDVLSSYEAAKAGKDAIIRVRERDNFPDYEQLKTEVGAPILDFDLFRESLTRLQIKSLEPNDLKRIHKSAQYVLWAATEAYQQAGVLDENLKIDPTVVAPTKSGIRVGTSIGGGEVIGDARRRIDMDKKRLTPAHILLILPERVATVPSMFFGVKGPVSCVIGACATASMNIINASEILTHKKRRADVMLAGGTDAVMTPSGVALFDGTGATDKSENPADASIPFGVNHRGIVMGEGAGVMVLETLEHAKKRGAIVLAEILGYSETSDAHHDTEPSGEGAELAMRMALQDARILRDDDISVDAHATGTKGDMSEIQTIGNVFNNQDVNGQRFCKDQVVNVSSRKAALGHTLAASGAIEAILAISAMREGVFLPSLKLSRDGQIPEAYGWPISPEVTTQARSAYKVIKNSFGFGGLNACIVYGLPA